MFLFCICFENFSNNSRKQRKTFLITCCKISLCHLNLFSFGSIQTGKIAKTLNLELHTGMNLRNS